MSTQHDQHGPAGEQARVYEFPASGHPADGRAPGREYPPTPPVVDGEMLSVAVDGTRTARFRPATPTSPPRCAAG